MRRKGPMGNQLMMNRFPMILALISATLVADDWPQWRGPARNGLVEKSPPIVNSLSPQSPLWQSEPIASGDQGGRGSLVVRAGRVYGLTRIQQGTNQVDELFCLSADNGKAIWRTKLSAPETKESGSSTPCIVDDRIYIVGSGNLVHCLNAETGSPIWETPLSRTGKEPIASSVTVAGGMAILLADVLTGMDIHTGKVMWQQERISGRESSPALWRVGGRDLVICNTNQETFCVDPARGDIVWSVDGGGKSTPVVAQEYGGDFLIVMSDSRKNGMTAYRLAPEGPKKMWTVRVSDRGSSPVVYDGHVYAVAGGSSGHGAHLVCVHIDSGQIAWDEAIDFAEVSSPVVADGKLMAVCGTFFWLLQASPERYSVLGQANYQITLCTSPAVFAGKLFLRQANAIACYDLRASP